MQLTKDMCKLIAELEYLIGSECYNPNSYDGWNNIEGREFRYPINVPNDKGEYLKIRDNIIYSFYLKEDDITPDAMSYMKYKFGSNELFIGKGIIKVLDYLEKRYDIDFNALEKKK